MRTATYKCGKCQWFRRFIFDGNNEAPKFKSCEKCHARAYREFGLAGTTPTRGWPMVSVAAGVFSDQIDEARQTDMTLGVPCDFTPDGDRIFCDRAHRRNWMRAHQVHDRSGGYGD